MNFIEKEAEFFKDLLTYLRVLMVKWPDIWKPTFWGQLIFDCIIKSTHLGDIPKAKSWSLGPHTVP